VTDAESYLKSNETEVAEESMVIGDRLRELREAKELSQGDIEKRTGLLRCYISRVENNHTVPAVNTLEKLARALEVPMYQLFHAGEASSDVRGSKMEDHDDHDNWGMTGRDREYVSILQKALGKMTPRDRNLLLHVMQKVAKRK
jgi:transcriptional regulator with XRE-family HTH domain